jgi:hypothetical protein
VPDEVEAQSAARVDDASVGDELHEVRGLLFVDVVRGDELEADRCRDHALLEVQRRELEPVAEELDDEVVPGPVVRRQHPFCRVSRLSDMRDRRLWAVMALAVVAIWLIGAAVTRYSLEKMAYYTPVAVVVVGATVGIVLLWVKVVTDSLRRRRGEQ